MVDSGNLGHAADDVPPSGASAGGPNDDATVHYGDEFAAHPTEELFAEAFPALADAMRKNVGGRPKAEHPKVAVSLRLDQDVVARFKASGPGWQTRMNNALRNAAGL